MKSPLPLWTQQHDNGWAANVCEAPGGRFVGWAAPAALPRVDILTGSVGHAQGGALMALRVRSAHTGCGAGCQTEWTESSVVLPPSSRRDDR